MDNSAGKEISMGDAVNNGGYLYKWYTDDGSTEYTGSITTRGMMSAITSDNIFEEDTTLIITLSSAIKIYDYFTCSSSVETNNYYVEKFGDGSWKYISDPMVIEYTVKKGHYFRLCSYATLFNDDLTVEIEIK